MVNPFKRDSVAAPVTPEVVAEPPAPKAPAVQLFGVPYQPDVYPELAFKYALLGASELELCELLDISHDTLRQWQKEHPIFRRSIVEGRNVADANVAHSLYRCALGYEREEVKIFQFQGVPVVVPFTAYYAPNVDAAKHWLRVRRKDKWQPTDAIDVNATQVVETKQISADATPEQAAELYKRMLG